jgi:hypothetical protein
MSGITLIQPTQQSRANSWARMTKADLALKPDPCSIGRFQRGAPQVALSS